MKIKQHCSNSDRIGFVRSIIPGPAWRQLWRLRRGQNVWTGLDTLYWSSLCHLFKNCCMFAFSHLPAYSQQQTSAHHIPNTGSTLFPTADTGLGSGAGEAKTFNLIIMMAGGWSVSSVWCGSDGRARSIFYGVLIDFGIETALTMGKTGVGQVQANIYSGVGEEANLLVLFGQEQKKTDVNRWIARCRIHCTHGLKMWNQSFVDQLSICQSSLIIVMHIYARSDCNKETHNWDKLNS